MHSVKNAVNPFDFDERTLKKELILFDDVMGLRQFRFSNL